MEKKNTVLLTVIAVATLLVAVVGATFAYFTASSTGTNTSNGTQSATTAEIAGVTLEMTTATSKAVADYPGGFVVTGVKVNAKDADANYAFNATYTIAGSVVNNTKTALNYTVYRVTSEVAANDLIGSCALQETPSGTATNYYYTGCTVPTSVTGGTSVATGTVAAAGDEEATTQAVAVPSQTQMTGTSANDKNNANGTDVWYYLVVEYPNANSSQNADMGKTITANLTTLTAGTYARATA